MHGQLAIHHLSRSPSIACQNDHGDACCYRGPMSVWLVGQEPDKTQVPALAGRSGRINSWEEAPAVSYLLPCIFLVALDGHSLKFHRMIAVPAPSSLGPGPSFDWPRALSPLSAWAHRIPSISDLSHSHGPPINTWPPSFLAFHFPKKTQA
jgi:hypothetical protein